MTSSSDFCLKWNDHHSVFFSTAEQLCGSNLLCDVTLSAGGAFFQAHKLVLSICSDYFHKLFSQSTDKARSTVIYMKDVDPTHLELILSYMYRGEITVKEAELMQLLAAASDLQVKGLSEMHRDKRTQPNTLETSKSMQEAGKPTEVEGRLKRKDSIETTRREANGMAEKSIVERTVAERGLTVMRPRVQAVKIPKLDPTLDTTNVKAEIRNNSLIHPDELIAEEELTNLSTNDVEQLDYSEGVADFDPSDYPEESNYFNFENQAPPINQKVKKAVPGKAFPCNMCDMSFDQKWLLKRHYRTHTRERPYRCSLCNRNFSLKDSCIRHIRNVHRAEMDSGEIDVNGVADFCQYDEGAAAMTDTDGNVYNEALAVAL